MEVGEKAGDESEGTDTERDTPEGEEEENIQGQREEQSEEQQVDPCGSRTAPSGLSCTTAVLVQDICKAVSLQFIPQRVHKMMLSAIN